MALKVSDRLRTGTAVALGVALGATALGAALQPRPGRGRRAATVRPARRDEATVVAARRLNRAAGTLALAVLADSAVEHYRGSFKNRVMVVPLAVATLALASSLHGTADMRPVAHRLRDAGYALAGLTGVVGSGFHVYNVGKKVGGFSWQNFFYGAPVGAPMALVLSGLLGFCSERVRETEAAATPRVFGMPAGRAIAVMAGAGLLGTTGEAALLHFRGAYHDPFMVLPVTLPPLGAALLADAAWRRRGDAALARSWMRLLAAMGLAGVGFHLYGVSRNMGGFRNWSQNILAGPPVPAPPSFTGLALAGLAALALMRERADA